jgi:hypothetical protein
MTAVRPNRLDRTDMTQLDTNWLALETRVSRIPNDFCRWRKTADFQIAWGESKNVFGRF